MHRDALSKTSVEILIYLSSKLRQTSTIRQIAGEIGQDYRITHDMTMRLARQKIITAEKRRHITYCRLNLKGNHALLAYVEEIRASRFLAKHRDVETIIGGILQKVTSPFFTMIAFGSHVKGTVSKISDLDVLLIIPNKEMENDVSSAIGSVTRISPMGIHDVILTSEEFTQLLRERKPNVAWEALDNRIVPYGAEPLFKILEEVM
jgi:hypothetical protein